tara:strand:- start:10842 stop:11015 length:174 start_codon:yes stop_codon:yes gene_type:complete
MSKLNFKKREMRYDPEKFLRMEYNGMEVLIEHDPLYDGPRKVSRGSHDPKKVKPTEK